MSEPEPELPPYVYECPPQNHPPTGTTRVQVYQEVGFAGVATQLSYPVTVHSSYPEFIGDYHQNYPGLNGAPQQNYPEFIGDYHQNYPGLNGAPQQNYPEFIGDYHQNYPGLNGAPQQNYPEFIGDSYQNYPGLNGAPQQNYPEFIGDSHQNYPGLNWAPLQNYPAISGTHLLPNYNQRAAKGLGITQMVLGVIMFILNVVLISTTGHNDRKNLIAYGIAGGIVFFFAGLLGVISARYCTRRTIIYTMVLSIKAATIAPILLVLGIVNSPYNFQNQAKLHTPSKYNNNSTTMATSVIMIILSLVELLISVIAFVYCCRAIRCGGQSSQAYLTLSNTPIEDRVPVPSAPPLDRSNQTPFQSLVSDGETTDTSLISLA